MLTTFEKTKISLYYRMIENKWWIAVKAFNFAQIYHCGQRKDGKPEFSHQVWIANYILTIPIKKKYMEVLLASIFLHDVCEDYDVTFKTIQKLFGRKVRNIVFLLSKEYQGVKVDEKLYFERMSLNVFAALAKGGDRLHNLSSMVGAFRIQKQKEYIQETREHHLPMLKKARRQFPQFERAFENIKMSIEARIELTEALISSLEKD